MQINTLKIGQFGGYIINGTIGVPETGSEYDEQIAAWLVGNTPEPADEPTAEELAEAAKYAEAVAFEGLPDWAAYTTTEAADAIHAAILAGDTLAQAQAKIDALPNTVAGMKTGLKQVVVEFITARGILEKMSKAIVYLRDRT